MIAGPISCPNPWAPTPGRSASAAANGSTLTIRVRNQGTEPAFVPTITRVRFAAGDLTATTPALPPGAAADAIVTIPSGCFSPDCNFTINVDAENAVQEFKHDASDTSHEDNNNVVGRCLG